MSPRQLVTGAWLYGDFMRYGGWRLRSQCDCIESQTDSKPQIRLLFELELSWALIGFVFGSFGVTYCTLWRLGINTLLFAHSDIVAELGRNWLT